MINILGVSGEAERQSGELTDEPSDGGGAVAKVPVDMFDAVFSEEVPGDSSRLQKFLKTTHQTITDKLRVNSTD